MPNLAGGTIADVDDNGRMILASGETLRQWGISITNLKAAREFLVGRMVSCVEVIDAPGRRSFDCRARGKDKETILDWFDLYVLLPEVGWAERTCRPSDFPKNALGGAMSLERRGITFGCKSDGTPRRGRWIE